MASENISCRRWIVRFIPGACPDRDGRNVRIRCWLSVSPVRKDPRACHSQVALSDRGCRLSIDEAVKCGLADKRVVLGAVIKEG